MSNLSSPSSDRLNVNINDVTDAELRRIRKITGKSYTEIVRQAVEALTFVNDEHNVGNMIQIYEPETDTVYEVTFIW